jgi:nucleoside recognition membrane protein YjiH
VPITFQGEQTILIGLLTNVLIEFFAPWLLQAVVAVTGVATVGGAAYLLLQPDWAGRRPWLYALCNVTPVWLVLRLAGFAIGLMVLLQIGPEVLRGEQTGETVFRDIGINSLIILCVACQLMPFLTEFGFMEFVGTLLTKPFQALFRLPGRSAIDATASFLSSAAVGLLITIGQYDRGYYTARESASVATNFSVVSLPFSLLIAKVAGVSHLYFGWYLTMILVCIVCAFVMVRLPPLSRMPDTYHPESRRTGVDAGASGSADRGGLQDLMLIFALRTLIVFPLLTLAGLWLTA